MLFSHELALYTALPCLVYTMTMHLSMSSIKVEYLAHHELQQSQVKLGVISTGRIDNALDAGNKTHQRDY